MVTAEDWWPGAAGPNCTVSLHFFFGKSCAGQFEAPTKGNPNCCGLVSGDRRQRGITKMIGGLPFLAGLRSVSVTLLIFPTFTLPKFSADGVTFSDSGTPVGVAVGVGVGVTDGKPVGVGVGVAVGDADELGVPVGVGVGVELAPNAITKLYALTVPMPVAKSHPVPAGYAG